jgi:hypothetical protein
MCRWAKGLPGLAGRHAGDRPGRVGHHLVHRCGVPAHRLHGRHHRQVLPRVWHHHRGGGDDLDVRQLHAGPDAVQHLARPQPSKPMASHAPVTLYDKTIGRVTGWFDHGHRLAGRRLPAHSALERCVHKLATWAWRWPSLSLPVFHGAAAGNRVCAQGRFFGDYVKFLHARGLVAGGHRSQGPPGGGHHPRASPRCATR